MAQPLTLPNIIGSNMVLQQKTKVPIWGLAKPGEIINIVTSWGEKKQAKANINGKWQIRILTPVALAGKAPTYTITITTTDIVIYFKNILVGEAWLCGGQSSMTFQMKLNDAKANESGVVNYESEIFDANYSNIRLFTVVKDSTVVPQFNCRGSWASCSKETVSNFSAVAYYFGRELYNNKSVNVHIELVVDAKSGSEI